MKILKKSRNGRLKDGRKRHLVLLVFLFLSFYGFAQSPKINGFVVDSNGDVMPGATVVVADVHGIGTTTDSNGEFLLEVKEGTMLEISFLGYKTQKVAAQKGIRIILEEAEKALDEIVVVGYGTAKKSDLTGAVASLTSKAFIDQPTSSANSILSGRAPGVSVRRTSGNPVEGSTIRIRGANSIYGNNAPLIVVDGNYEENLPSAYDIEAIEILKDASATAIYGSRGANGVILVTSKRGKEGKPTVKLNTSISVSQMTKRYDLMNAYEFASYHKEAGDHPFTDSEIAKFKVDPAGTDWQDEILQTGLSQDYKVTVYGGSKNVNYYISPYYNKSTGVMKNSEANSYGITTKTDIILDKKVSVQVELNAGHNDNLNKLYGSTPRSNTSLPLMAALMWSPTESVYKEDGSLTRTGVGTGTLLSPVLLISPRRTTYKNFVNTVGNLKVKIIDGLELNAKGSVNLNMGGMREFVNENYNVYAEAEQQSYEEKTWLVNVYLNYSKTFARKHNFSVMAGFEETKTTRESLSGNAKQLSTESVSWYNLGLGANITVGSDYTNSALRSYFGRANYNYDSRYYVTVNFRADGSSKFRPGNQFGYFPSFSLAWRLSEEKFMKEQNIFQNIKLRGGWGTTGSQAVSPYATYSTLRLRYYTWGTNTRYPGYSPVIGGNPDLKWESTKQLNVGLDFSILDNRVSVSLDYYNKKTVDLLAPVDVPAYAGGVEQYGKKSIISNVGSVRNEGYEFNINWDVIQNKNFAYDLNFNGAFNRNKVLDLGDTPMVFGESYGGSDVSPFVLMPGQPIGTIYGLKYLGIWQENEAAEAVKFGQEPGDYKYEDLNDNNNYDTGDYQVLGNTNPKFTWGLNNHFSFKDIDLNILFEGAHKRDVLNHSRMKTIEVNMFTNREALDTWAPENPNAEFAKRGPTNRFNSISSQYMEDASYVKLRNISLSYRFPRKLIPFADLQLSVSAQNLLTITKYKGYDPEISSTSNDDANSGMDWFAYPASRSFSFGLSIIY